MKRHVVHASMMLPESKLGTLTWCTDNLQGGERINPISKWQEEEKIEGVTLFELNGPPRAQMTDPKVLRTYRARPLSEELTCPICLGLLRDTVIVKEVCVFYSCTHAHKYVHMYTCTQRGCCGNA